MLAIFKKIPMNRILIETDAPFLAPHPHRGKNNEPSLLKYTAEYLSKLLNISFEAFSLTTTNNFFQLFKKVNFCINNKFI